MRSTSVASTQRRDRGSPDVWISRQCKVAFIANPRTASREIGQEVLKRRGFSQLYGHHGVPWGPENPRPSHYEMAGDSWDWYLEDEQDWTWYASHRNHFEVFHSIAYAGIGGNPPTPERFEYYLWRHPMLYRRGAHILFPSFWEVRDCQEIRFDHTREDVAALLERHGLPPLRPDELIRSESQHHTMPKPRGEHYSAKLDPLCREWIEERYHREMARFGYAWSDHPVPAPARG